MGKISKPQKSSKHKKIKAVDPFYVGKRAVDRHAKEANQPPKGENDQDMTHSMKELLHRKTQIQKKQLRREKLKKERKNNPGGGPHGKAKEEKFSQFRMERGMSRPYKPAAEFKQGKKETKKAFINRMERETQSVISKSRFEDKYGVELSHKPDGQVEIINPVSEAKKEKRKERKQKKKEKKAAAQVDLHPGKKKDFRELKDKVEFGEVAMEPPTITAKPRSAPKAKTGPSTLLLARQLGQVQKKKNMSMAQQFRLDNARELAIELYRKAKNNPT